MRFDSRSDIKRPNFFSTNQMRGLEGHLRGLESHLRGLEDHLSGLKSHLSGLEGSRGGRRNGDRRLTFDVWYHRSSAPTGVAAQKGGMPCHA